MRRGLCGRSQQWNFGMVFLCCSCHVSPFGWYPSKGCHHRGWLRSPALCPCTGRPWQWTACQTVVGSFVFLSLWPLVHCLKAHGCFLVKDFSTREIKVLMLFLEMLKATLDPDLATSALIRWCWADSSNINDSMILSSMEELINDKICLDSAEIEVIFYNKLSSLGAIAAHTVDFSALKLQAQLMLACQHLSPLSVLICVIPFCQRAWIHCKIIPLQGHWRQKSIQIPWQFWAESEQLSGRVSLCMSVTLLALKFSYLCRFSPLPV